MYCCWCETDGEFMLRMWCCCELVLSCILLHSWLEHFQDQEYVMHLEWKSVRWKTHSSGRIKSSQYLALECHSHDSNNHNNVRIYAYLLPVETLAHSFACQTVVGVWRSHYSLLPHRRDCTGIHLTDELLSENWRWYPCEKWCCVEAWKWLCRYEEVSDIGWDVCCWLEVLGPGPFMVVWSCSIRVASFDRRDGSHYVFVHSASVDGLTEWYETVVGVAMLCVVTT